jgi:Zn-dependent M28 family amino/carboxypeptidase
VVPGANDNLTGVAVLLSLAHAFHQDPVEGTRVVLLSTGSEESFMEGMRAFARRHFPSLPRDRTYVLCVDTVGSPNLLLLEGEGMLGIREYPKDFLDVVKSCARELGIYLVPNLRFRNATDGFIALQAGYPSGVIASVDEYKAPTNYHWPTDTPENVRYETVADAARLCDAVVRRLAAAGSG